MKNKTVQNITFIGMYLALFFVLDFISNQIGLFKMPQGGTLSLGIIPLILSSYHLGWKNGLITCLLSVLLMFITGQMYIVTKTDGFNLIQIIIQFLMEYPIAFGVYGLSSLFPTVKKFYSGALVTNLIRLVLHVIAGTLYWGSPLSASIAYNSWYMIPEAIVCVILIPLIYERIKKSIKA